MSKWMNGSLEELLGLAPSERRSARRIATEAEERARIASIGPSLEELSARDREWRAWRGDRVSRG